MTKSCNLPSSLHLAEPHTDIDAQRRPTLHSNPYRIESFVPKIGVCNVHYFRRTHALELAPEWPANRQSRQDPQDGRPPGGPQMQSDEAAEPVGGRPYHLAWCMFASFTEWPLQSKVLILPEQRHRQLNHFPEAQGQRLLEIFDRAGMSPNFARRHNQWAFGVLQCPLEACWCDGSWADQNVAEAATVLEARP